MLALTCARPRSGDEDEIEVVRTRENATALSSARQIPVKGWTPERRHHRSKSSLARGAHGRLGGGADQAGPHPGVPPAPTPHGKAPPPIARVPRGPDCRVPPRLTPLANPRLRNMRGGIQSPADSHPGAPLALPQLRSTPDPSPQSITQTDPNDLDPNPNDPKSSPPAPAPCPTKNTDQLNPPTGRSPTRGERVVAR